VLIDKEGRVAALIISVGGFLGMGEKDVAVPFSSVRASEKNNKWYLVLNTNKEALKTAPGFTYDKTKTTWIPAARQMIVSAARGSRPHRAWACSRALRAEP
jgi:hypothetical protein